MSRQEELKRAQQLLNQQGPLHCCQFVAMCIYNDKSKNQQGANGWQIWGQKANGFEDARVVWQNGHVGFVGGDGYVYYSSGYPNGSHKKKTYQEYQNYVLQKPYGFRK